MLVHCGLSLSSCKTTTLKGADVDPVDPVHIHIHGSVHCV